MQVYKLMNIGTAKATKEEMASIPHHLIDIVYPDQEYNAKQFTLDCMQAIQSIHSRGKVPLLTGGTGLYLKALTEGLFEEIGSYPEIRNNLKKQINNIGLEKLHEQLSAVDHEISQKIHRNDTHRIIRGLEIYLGTGKTWSQHIQKQKTDKEKTPVFTKILLAGLTDSRENLYRRINTRTATMLDNGLEAEVRNLIQRGYSRDLKSMRSIGYRHMISYLYDGWSFDKLLDLLARDTRRYAKRQYTWFNKMNISWFNCNNFPALQAKVAAFLQSA